MGWVMVDDLTGVPITDGAGGPVRITVDDDTIEIDLSTSGRDDLIDMLRPYFNAGRAVDTGTKRKAASPAPNAEKPPATPRPADVRSEGEPTDSEVRAWARDRGMDVGSIGRVKREIRDAYIRAHREPDQPQAYPLGMVPGPGGVGAVPAPEPPKAQSRAPRRPVPAAPSSARPPVQTLDRRRPEQLEKAEELLADDEPVHSVATATGMTVAQVRDLKAAIERGAAAS